MYGCEPGFIRHQARKERDMIEGIIALFSAIPEVEAIYRDINTVWVFTGNEAYDDALMDRLIAREEELAVDYPDALLWFVPSVLVANYRDDCVGNDAVLIYERHAVREGGEE